MYIDLAIGLRTGWPIAETLKCTHGTAALESVGEDEMVQVPGVSAGLQRRSPVTQQISLRHGWRK